MPPSARAPLPPPPGRPSRGAAGRAPVAALGLLGVLALAALAALALRGAGPDPGERAVRDFASAWARGDYPAMRVALSGSAARRTSVARLARTYRAAAQVATLERVRPGEPRRTGEGRWELPVSLRTRSFGRIDGRLRLDTEGEGDGAGVDWSARLAFPGLRVGEALTAQTRLPPRAALLARDGTPLAEGPARASRLGPLAAEVVGRLGPVAPERAAELARRGVPGDAQVGLTGLEREFDDALRGAPGGTLRGGSRVLARRAPRRAPDVRTSIDPAVQAAAVAALGGRFGGVAVLAPRTGEVLALAGIAVASPQPPGSTFKIVTLAAALDAGRVRPTSAFPVETAATIEGVELENANGELCGGSLATAFAESCNSVFAPLGVRVGARRLVAAAEAFGFNEPPALRGAARSTLPAASEVGDDLALGATAIGQGKVLATPLSVAGIAATIANAGLRPRLSLRRGGADTAPVRATSARAARVVGRLMRQVVARGTGTAAQIPGVSVAGKTGTAELRDSTRGAPAAGADVAPGTVPEEDPSDTDAWFTAYAPASAPRVAVGVLLVGQGAGGTTAAPVAREVLAAALEATR